MLIVFQTCKVYHSITERLHYDLQCDCVFLLMLTVVADK
jgi:hypothetical protein